MCRAGDVVTVLGVAEVASGEATGGALQRQRNATLFDIYISAVSVVKRRGAGAEHAQQPLSTAAAAAFKRGLPNLDAEDAYFAAGANGANRNGGGWLSVEGFEPDVVERPSLTPSDLEFIVRFSEECAGEQLKQLTHSLCPTIIGQELVKAGWLRICICFYFQI
jgi:DNA helicase MCM8